MPAPAPECPACRYDLSGIVASWAWGCPLRGTCPECGRALRWADVLSARSRPPPWSFEHSARPSLRSMGITLVRLAEPIGFFRATRATGRQCPARVAALLAAALSLGVLVGLAFAAWTSPQLESASALRIPAPSLLVDSYRDTAEPLIYLCIWLVAGTLCMVCFGRGRDGLGGLVIGGVLYACIGLSVAWSALAISAMIDMQLLARYRIAGGAGGRVSAVLVAGAWLWLLAACAGLALWRLPLRHPRIAWLASQAAAALAIVAFAELDESLPF